MIRPEPDHLPCRPPSGVTSSPGARHAVARRRSRSRPPVRPPPSPLRPVLPRPPPSSHLPAHSSHPSHSFHSRFFPFPSHPFSLISLIPLYPDMREPVAMIHMCPYRVPGGPENHDHPGAGKQLGAACSYVMTWSISMIQGCQHRIRIRDQTRTHRNCKRHAAPPIDNTRPNVTSSQVRHMICIDSDIRDTALTSTNAHSVRVSGATKNRDTCPTNRL